jgi:hypothetical protein
MTSPLQSFSFLAWLAVSLGASLGLSTGARAAPGCFRDGSCEALPDPCDDACDTGVCVEDTCAPTDCVPCDTAGDCPGLRLGRVTVTGRRVMSACRYDLGCGTVTIREGDLMPSEPRCVAGRSGDARALLDGDCDGDRIPFAAEGIDQACVRQSYVGRDGSAGTCDSTCTSGCLEFLPPGSNPAFPHGGSVCNGSSVGAYACADVEDCPSTAVHPATRCVEAGPEDARACIYQPTCGSPDACFDFISAAAGMDWIPAAYAAGDCDEDGLRNGADPDVCTPATTPTDAGLASPDAAASDASMSTPEDAFSADAASRLDAGHAELDAPRDAALLGPVSFQGSGCACRAQGTRPGAHLALLGALGLALGARARRAARRRG